MSFQILSSFSGKLPPPTLHQTGTFSQVPSELAQTISVPSFSKATGSKHWMPNESSTTCYDCGKSFGLLLRKHHCRVCGIIFCKFCSSRTLTGRQFGLPQAVRVCNYCYSRYTKGVTNESNDPRSKRVTSSVTFKNNHEVFPVNSKKSGNFWQEDANHPSMEIGYSTYSSHYESRNSDNYSSVNISNNNSSKSNIKANNNRLGLLKDPSKIQKSNSESQVFRRGDESEDFDTEEESDEDLFNLPRSTRRRSSIGLSIKELFQNLSKNDHQESKNENSDTESDWKYYNDEEVVSQLEVTYSDHVLYLVTHLAKKFKLSKQWINTIINLSDQTISNVKNNQNKLNILDDVNIKIVPKGKIENSSYISGVVFAKFIPHKKMRTNINNPRLLLFSCALSFEREENRFSQFDILLEQEERFLRILVEKIVSLKPDLLIVEKSVSIYAMKLFIEENITVITDIEPSILLRIARYTNSHIFNSTSEIMLIPSSNIPGNTSSNMNMNIQASSMNIYQYPFFSFGRATKFKIEVYHIDNDQWKSIMFIEVPTKEVGCSIVLHGETRSELLDAKKVLMFAIFAKYMQKYEISFIKENNMQQNSLSGVLLNIIRDDKKFEFIHKKEKANKRKSPPFLKRSKTLLSLSSSSDDSSGDKKKLTRSTSDFIYINSISRDIIDQYTKYYAMNSYKGVPNANHFAKFSRMLSSCPNIFYTERRDIEPGDLLQDWPAISVPSLLLFPNFSDDRRSSSKMINSNLLNNIYPSFFCFNQTHPDPTPFNQSNIIYLHSLCNSETGKQCIPFSMHRIHFSNHDDMTFGEFLTKYCFTMDACKVRGCGYSILDHERTILHDQGRLTFTISKTETTEEFIHSDDTLFWATCSKCSNCHTPVVILSQETLNYSLGMWISMNYYYHGALVANSSNSACKHSIFRDYTRHYMRNHLVVTINFESLKIYKTTIPTFRLKYNESHAERIRQQELNIIQDTANKVFSLIDDHIDELNATAKSQEEIDNLDVLKERKQEEKEKFFKRLDLLKKNSKDIYEINLFKRLLFITSTTWNSTLQEVLLNRNNSKSHSSMSSVNLRKSRISSIRDPDNPYLNYDPISVMFSRDNLSNELKVVSTKNRQISQLFTAPSSSQNTFPNLSTTPPRREESNNLRFQTPSILISPSSSSSSVTSNIYSNSPKDDRLSPGTNYYSYFPHSVGELSQMELNFASKDSSSHKSLSPLHNYNNNNNHQLHNHHNNNVNNHSGHRRKESIGNHNNINNSIAINNSGSSSGISFNISLIESQELTNNPFNFIENNPDLENTRSSPINIGDQDYIREESFPALGKSPGKGRSGRNRLSTVEGLISILPNLTANATPNTLPLPLLQDSSGLFFQDGIDSKCVVVNENEPSSILAYALTTSEYAENLIEFQKQIMGDHYEKESSSLNNGSIDIKEEHIPLLSESKSHIDVFFKSSHNESKVKCTVSIHYAAQFKALRDLCVNEDEFIQSISRCKRWQATGGKSGATWEKTLG